ncbi:MAG: chorismate mutase [Candidatus Aminicenantes bacterium]|nr:chorismate mutase [Candidatus Aminicenantes bacterium]
MNLEDIRARINGIDRELIKLLNERMEWSIKTRIFKPAVIDKNREKGVLRNINSYLTQFPCLSSHFVQTLFRMIIRESRKQQREGSHFVNFQTKKDTSHENVNRIPKKDHE